MKFDRTPPTPLTGNEQFTADGKSLGFTTLDFWSFQFSNVWDIYEEVAEFIVAKALGLTVPYNKNGWTSYDINYRGKRVEVKCTAYYHSWRADGVSKRRSFGIQEAYGYPDEKDCSTRKERQNDVYVFCLNTGKNKEEANPFEMNHWEFYVLPTSTIYRKFGKQRTVSVSCLRGITNKVSYIDLKAAIDNALGLE